MATRKVKLLFVEIIWYSTVVQLHTSYVNIPFFCIPIAHGGYGNRGCVCIGNDTLFEQVNKT